MFARPCFVVVDHEFAGAISTRKLVLETARFNVLTAYSFQEAEVVLDRFPGVDAVVVTASRDSEAQHFLEQVKMRHPRLKRILTGESNVTEDLVHAHVTSYAPDTLLSVLRDLFPQQAHTAAENEEELGKRQHEADQQATE